SSRWHQCHSPSRTPGMTTAPRDHDRLRVGTTPPKSEAGSRFEASSMEVGQLREIHEEVSGTDRGRRNLEVLNKSAIVLICAIWEPYCKDLAGRRSSIFSLKSTTPRSSPWLSKSRWPRS